MTGECDCCGKQGEISGPLIVCGIETYACEKCRGIEEDVRMIPCESCDGSGRDYRETGEFSRFDGAVIVRDCGPCPVCNGSLVEEIAVEPITLEDLDAQHEREHNAKEFPTS